jgi:prolyl oligopeptidase
MKTTFATLLPLAALLLAGCAESGTMRMTAKPPATKKDPVVETLHGVEIVDDYRWLEPLEKDSPEVEAWTTAQNGYTREVLGALPCRERLAKALEPWMTLDAIGAPTMTDAGYFHSERSGTQNQPVVRFRTTVDGPSRTLLDVNALDAQGLTSLDWWRPNEQGTLMAFGTSQRGSEMSELRILDMATGKWLPDAISGKVSFSGWMPDGRSFFYSALRDAPPRHRRRHREGSDRRPADGSERDPGRGPLDRRQVADRKPLARLAGERSLDRADGPVA